MELVFSKLFYLLISQSFSLIPFFSSSQFFKLSLLVLSKSLKAEWLIVVDLLKERHVLTFRATVL